jgi:uncharacterized membrane protein
MILLAQVTPGVEQAIQAAANTGRWEAVALVVVMLMVVGLLVWLVKSWIAQAGARDVAAAVATAEREKQSIDREARLAKRVDGLEEFIRNNLLQALNENTKAMLSLHVSSAETTNAVTKLIESLHTTRICFATGEQQTRLVDTIASRVVSHIIQAAHEHKIEVTEPHRK